MCSTASTVEVRKDGHRNAGDDQTFGVANGKLLKGSMAVLKVLVPSAEHTDRARRLRDCDRISKH